VRFASFFSVGLTTIAVMNPPEKKLKKRTSVSYALEEFETAEVQRLFSRSLRPKLKMI
jgi:hypothetical protein